MQVLVVMDTEGLLSVEARDDVFDKQARCAGKRPRPVRSFFYFSSPLDGMVTCTYIYLSGVSKFL